MPRILFIAAHRPDRSPSQRYRFEQYFSFLRGKGYECELSFIINEKDDQFFYRPGNILKKIIITVKSAVHRWNDIKRAKDFDIIFVQREAFMTGSAFFEKRFAKSGAKMVFDFDDSIWMLDTSAANRSWQWLKSAGKTRRIIALSDLVIAGNQYLADYAMQFNSNVQVIPTTIDTAVFKRQSPYSNNPVINIGWSGSITTIRHFQSALPVLRRIREKYGKRVAFTVMGDADYYDETLQVRGIPWTHETEVEVLSTFDIGIMPLPDDEWVKGKCGLKALSYMSLGIPVVISSVGVNPTIVSDDVNGFLAGNADEWFEKLCLLIESYELRCRLGEAGRRAVVEKYSLDSQKNNYLACFDKLLNR